MNSKISVIVAVYNVEQYLDRCIQSILNQSYNNLEIILVDDGSTDSSGDICDKYKMEDERIIVFHQNNGGPARARNKGLEISTGEWIGFVDADDEILTDFYLTLLKDAIQNHVLIAGCPGLAVIEGKETYNNFVDWESGIKLGNDLVLDILYQTKHTWGAMWNKLYNASLKSDLISLDVYNLEDYIINLRLFRKCESIYFESKPLYKHYFYSNSLSSGLNNNKLQIFETLEYIKEKTLIKENSFELNNGIYYFCLLNRVTLLYQISKIDDIELKYAAVAEIENTKRYFQKVKSNRFVGIKKLFQLKLLFHVSQMRLFKVKKHR